MQKHHLHVHILAVLVQEVLQEVRHRLVRYVSTHDDVPRCVRGGFDSEGKRRAINMRTINMDNIYGYILVKNALVMLQKIYLNNNSWN